MNWRDVEKMLCDRAEEVARYLLPNGKRDGEEWVCGDIDGKPGKSFKVNIGSKAGLHCDFAGNHGGPTFMALWCSVRQAPFKDAITEAKKFLGLRDDWESRFSKRGGVAGAQSRRQDYEPMGGTPSATAGETPATTGKFDAASLKNFKALEEGGAVHRYLTQVRGFEDGTLWTYRIGETLDGRGIVYPYFVTPTDEESETQPKYYEREASWLKFELLERKDGKKVEWTTRGPEKCLFGKALVPKSARSIVITEGEKDAMAWGQYGQWAVSVPFGAKWRGQDKHKPSPNREWIDRDYEWLTQFETIYVCFDSDAAGRKAAMDVVREIGERLCRLVSLPLKPMGGTPSATAGETPATTTEEERYKDANDCLMAGVSREVMEECLKKSREFAPEKVRNANDFKAEFYEDWFEGTGEKGLFIPIEVPFRVRRGEATVWTGFGGHGKSKFLSFVLAGLMCQGERACVASMEVRTRQTLHDLSRQVWGAGSGIIGRSRRMRRIRWRGRSRWRRRMRRVCWSI
jgi:twinkle protein